MESMIDWSWICQLRFGYANLLMLLVGSTQTSSNLQEFRRRTKYLPELGRC